MILIGDIQKAMLYLSYELCGKINNKENIYDEKNKLKKLQILLINYINFCFSVQNLDISFANNYYHITNFFRDIDFCLKIFLSMVYVNLNTKSHNLFNELISCLNICEPRFLFFSFYLDHYFIHNIINEKSNNIMNDTLTIKDFIILGDKRFHEKIKTIEKNIKSNSFQYLNIGQIRNYLKQKKKEKGSQIVPYFYFLVIRLEEYKENFENLFMLTLFSGITFFIFLYIENENASKIHKNIINFVFSTILVFSTEDIKNYLFHKRNFINILDNRSLEDIIDLKIPKITFEQCPEDQYQDGCFELAETFNVDLIKNKYLIMYGQSFDFTTEFSKNLYHIYKEHNALDLFYSQNCIYFGWTLYPEMYSSNICFVKRLLYMYCREETPSQKSFYRIVNDDLRSRDPSKIYRYINILALINLLIQEGGLSFFEGKVYRATKLDEKLIMKLNPGVKMVNTTFWSTSKDFKVAENMMIKNNFRNSFTTRKTFKNNTDIDFEGSNPPNEKEALLSPFTEFKLEKVSSIIKYGKKVFIIELTELSEKNFVNPNNMKIEKVNNIPMDKVIDNFCKKKGVKFEDLIKNFKLEDLSLSDSLSS